MSTYWGPDDVDTYRTRRDIWAERIVTSALGVVIGLGVLCMWMRGVGA